MNRFYVVSITLTSSGSEDRKLTPYDDLTTATRKFHEAFNNIGAGPKRVCVVLLDTYLNELKRESWEDAEAVNED